MNLTKQLRNFLLFSQVFWLPRYYIFFKLTDVSKGRLILDAGCGLGLVSFELARKGFKVVAVDKSREDIARARRLSSEYGLQGQVLFAVADLARLPFKEHCFERVVALDSLEYLADDGLALKEFSRILKAKGTLALSLPQGYACSARLFAAQRILRKVIPPFLFSRDLPGSRAWLTVDDGFIQQKLGDQHNRSLESLRMIAEPFFKIGRYDFFLKVFSSLATDITYGVKGLHRLKPIFFSIAVRLDHYCFKKSLGYGLFTELINNK